MLKRAALGVALFLSSAVAVADSCPVPAGTDPKLAALDSALRLKYLRDNLAQEGKDAYAWKWNWVGGYGVLAVGQVLAAPFTSSTDQAPGLYAGGIAAAIGSLPLLLNPLKIVKDGPTFDAKVEHSPSADACTLIKEGEELMIHDGHNEASGAAWYIHIVNVVYNAAVALIIGFGFHNDQGVHNWTSAGITGGVGALVGEAMIFSQPNHLQEAWHTYESGVLVPPEAPPAAKPGEGTPAVVTPPKASIDPPAGPVLAFGTAY